MKWRAALANDQGRHFVIWRDEAVGFYVEAFEGEFCTHDYLLDTFEVAVAFAREKFGVPEEAWEMENL